MNYELAKELMHAGFPQKEPLLYPPYRAGDDTSQMPGVYFPTLSELIEACKPSDYERFYLYHYRNLGWYAEVETIDSRDGQIKTEASGSTREEAVANLWLALHS